MMRQSAALAVLSAAMTLAVVAAPGAQESQKLGSTVDKTVETQQRTQQRQDQWVSEQADLTARYRSARSHVEYLEKRREFEQKEVGSLEASIAELERRLVESEKLNESLQDTLNAVVGRLEAMIANDVPFLVEERDARISSLKEEIARPDVAGAEKLRRVLEALQVEANYGNTVEVYQEEVRVGDEDIFADMLRVGRVSVYWRTPDGKRVGEYDRGLGQWVELDGKYVRPINLTVEMASRIRPTELIELPVGRIEP